MRRQRTVDQVVGTFIGAIVMGIVRLVIAGAMGFNFVLYSNTVMASTIVGAMVIPIVGIVLFSVLKKNLGKDPKMVFGLRVGILAAAITSLIIIIFGMSSFLTESGDIYSYTPFDAFVRDFVGLMETGDTTTSILYLFDDIFVIMIFVISIQSVILASKNMPRNLKTRVPVQTQTQPPSTLPVPQTVPVNIGNTCTNCGALRVNVNQKFCEMCGTQFPPATVMQPAVNTEVSAPASVSPAPPATTVEPGLTPPQLLCLLQSQLPSHLPQHL